MYVALKDIDELKKGTVVFKRDGEYITDNDQWVCDVDSPVGKRCIGTIESRIELLLQEISEVQEKLEEMKDRAEKM